MAATLFPFFYSSNAGPFTTRRSAFWGTKVTRGPLKKIQQEVYATAAEFTLTLYDKYHQFSIKFTSHPSFQTKDWAAVHKLNVILPLSKSCLPNIHRQKPGVNVPQEEHWPREGFSSKHWPTAKSDVWSEIFACTPFSSQWTSHWHQLHTSFVTE